MSSIRVFVGAALLATASGAGCAKNVDRIEFQKWGYSYVPRLSSIDTSTQGGAAQKSVVPSSAGKSMPAAAVGGAYERSTATSPNYRLMGGFHITPTKR